MLVGVFGSDVGVFLLKVLGHLLVYLGLLIAWVVILLPIRPKELSLMPPSGVSLKEAVLAEQSKLEAAGRSSDPTRRLRYHSLFAGVGALIFVIMVGLNVALYLDGRLMLGLALFAVILPFITGYHAIQAIRFKRRA